jgi:putative transcriptional regulator
MAGVNVFEIKKISDMTLKRDDKKRTNVLPAAGRILISEPLLQDFYFRRSIVLLADHSDEGTFGLIINKPVDVRFNDVIKGFPNYKGSIYLGGPVQTSTLYFVHTMGDMIEGSMKILDGLYWGGDIEQVKEMMTLNQLTSHNIRFFIGYSGWVSNQLDRELDENSWVVWSANTELLIKSNPENLWRDLVKSLGPDYAIWANYPTDPLMN